MTRAVVKSKTAPKNLARCIQRARGAVLVAWYRASWKVKNRKFWIPTIFFRNFLKIFFFHEMIKAIPKISSYFFRCSFQTFLLQKLLQWFIKLVLENPRRIPSEIFLQILSEILIMIFAERLKEIHAEINTEISSEIPLVFL